MRTNRLLCAVVLFLVTAAAAPVPGLAQSYLVHVYTENDGLINNQVHGAAQDAKGRMWFATRGGVSMYDGFSWHGWSTSNGLSGNVAMDVALDVDGHPWFLITYLEGTIATIRDGNIFSVPLPVSNEIPLEPILLAAGISGGAPAFLVGTRYRGLFLYHGDEWRRYHTPDGLSGGAIKGLLFSDGAFYVATEGGLSVIRDGKVDNALNDRHPVLKRGVLALSGGGRERKGRIWLCGPDWVGFLENGKLTTLHASAALSFLSRSPLVRPVSTSSLVRIAPDGYGGCFVGNAVVLMHCPADGSPPLDIDVESGLAGAGAAGMALDRERNLWVANPRGVSKISGLRFLNFQKTHGLFGDEVSAIAKVGPGRLILGHNGGLSYLGSDAIRAASLEKEDGLIAAENRVLDIQTDGDGMLWIATSGYGLGSVRHEGPVRWIGRGEGIGGKVRTLFIDEAGTFWVSTGPELYILQDNRFIPVPLPDFNQMYIRKIFQGPEGSIDLATNRHGLLRISSGSWRQISHPERPAANNVYAVHLDRQGHTWVGTEAGLFFVRNGRLVESGAETLSIERPIYLIVEDLRGRLWFGTDNGVIRWDGSDLTLRVYATRSGLAGLEINRSAGVVDGEGRLWIGTNSGVSYYREEYDPDPADIPVPHVEITALDIKGLSVPLQEPLRLNHSKNHFTFHVSAPSFIDETAVRFRTLLEGFDTVWSEPFRSLEPKILYMNLPPGRYRFYIQAANALGVWSAPAVSPVIRISRAFWQTVWFALLVLAVGVGISVGAFHFVAAHRYANRLEREVEMRTAQLQASLSEKNVLLKEIHHRVKNNLQIISSLLFLQARKIQNDEDRFALKESMTRIRTMALVHETIYGSANLAAVSARAYFSAIIDQLMSTFGIDKERVSIDIEATNIALTVETAVPCGLIVNELVSNALKHAFPEGRKGRIEVRMALDEPESGMRDPKYHLVVKDDGKGFGDDFNVLNIESLGLRLVFNLATQLGGSVEVDREEGTTFTIRF
ncbi:MAG: histidine kinase dimerization/phosphoacceptor domain -containing protein [Acidobacteriota bacterium]|nr:histidine kinase dimerization/phosphoacceptor domain -containing protein [Acidobacteriota bacterium]